MTTPRDHTEITLLVDRFFRALDERTFTAGWGRAFFTDDIVKETPFGIFRGPEVVRATEEAVERFDRTQHMASGVLTDQATDADADADADPGMDAGSDTGAESATASWDALMTHVHHAATLRERGSGADPLFVVGGRFETELRRTPEGWRFTRMAVRPVWTTGQPPPGIDPEMP
ncbi:nuclear transport factor 2 family protein [Streptomyces sp. NPDC046203]|uniref:nuclear transport factor 2 family protein n=1 Tax=Streptomyces sp. NPDC046203 TaxID=3154602 RepID=UPI00340604D0